MLRVSCWLHATQYPEDACGISVAQVTRQLYHVSGKFDHLEVVGCQLNFHAISTRGGAPNFGWTKI